MHHHNKERAKDNKEKKENIEFIRKAALCEHKH